MNHYIDITMAIDFKVSKISSRSVTLPPLIIVRLPSKIIRRKTLFKRS